MSSDTELGQRIAEARESLGWTQKQLAEAVGRSERTIQAWEAGTNRPPARLRLKVIEVLGLEGDEADTRSEWPRKVQDLTTVLGDLMATLSPEDLLRWRHQFILAFVRGDVRPSGAAQPWPSDVEVIVDIIGASLANAEQTRN